MLKELCPKYANITAWTIEVFKSYCMESQRKRKRKATTGVVVRPILSEEFNSSGQVDLIDMQSMPSNTFRWIMVYQDHLTKFCILRALTSKREAAVAFLLADIFLTIGAPAILQSDNGSEFTASVIKELKGLWSDLKIVHGKPRHPQNQGSVERANGDIKDMLTAWLEDNQTADWSMGIKFVQFSKNSSYHCGIKRSPYEALFGTRAKVGLTSSSLPQEMIDSLQHEEELIAALTPTTSEETEEDTTPESDDETDPTPTEDAGDEPAEVMPVPHSGSSPDRVSVPDIPPALTPMNHNMTVPTLFEEPSEAPILSPAPALLQQRQYLIEDQRLAARTAQSSQADRMVKRRRLELPAAQIGDNVAIPIPQVDRGRGDPRNIVGIVIDSNPEMDSYKIAVKAGTLRDKYFRNQFNVCPKNLISEADINQDRTVSLREAVTEQSKCGGQGFKKCNCGSKQCRSNRCACYKARVKCNSRCHSSLTYSNK